MRVVNPAPRGVYPFQQPGIPIMAKTPPGTKRVEVYIPPELAARMEELLHSSILGRIPHGAWNAFVLQRIREFFTHPRRPLDGFNGFYAGDWISGNAHAVSTVLDHLTRAVPDEVDSVFPELDPRQGADD